MKKQFLPKFGLARSLGTWGLLTLVTLVGPAPALGQGPIVPKPLQPKATAPAGQPIGTPAGGVPGKAAPPPTKPGEVDWRGLDEDGKRKGKPAASPVTALIENAPYRVEIASSDGQKVLITNAFTLERRRVLQVGSVAGFGFSGDGTWLYVATSQGEVTAVDAETAKTQPLGRAALRAGEVIVDLLGAGDATSQDLTLLIGQGNAPTPGNCSPYTGQRRVRIRRDNSQPGPIKQESHEGWPNEALRQQLTAVSPNTKYKVTAAAGALMATGRFGGGDLRIHRTPVPPALVDLDWMRDSNGLIGTWPRKADHGCPHLLSLRAWRAGIDKGKEPGWHEWNLPETIQVVPGDRQRALSWAADGMRFVAVAPAGVMLVEPAPRFRGVLALVAPPSTVWPKLRPGVRALATVAGGNLRLAELMMEQGDLDAATKQLAVDGRGGGPDVTRLQGRLTKLIALRERRAQEWQVPLDDLRSQKSGKQGVPLPVQPTPTPGVAPAIPPTPSAATPTAPAAKAANPAPRQGSAPAIPTGGADDDAASPEK